MKAYIEKDSTRKNLIIPLRGSVLLALAVALLLAVCAHAEGGRKLTLMVYMCGSNLESGYGAASSDIEEMQASGFDSDRISLLIMAGGSESWRYGFSPDELTINELGRRGVRTVWRGEAASMGAPESLHALMTYAASERPAEKYALILWDHGGGPLEGVCWDELFSMDQLTLSELTQALADSPLPGKLSWIGFDACLMGSAEVANALAPYAEYMIASQETEPAAGWNYSFLNGLEDDSNGAETGRRIVDAYFADKEGTKDVLTLACTDLSRMGDVVASMDSFFAPIGRQLNADSFASISSRRMSATGFGKSIRGVGEEGYDLVDLGDLVKEYGGVDFGVEDALANAIVYSRSNEEGACGLSIYHPFANKRKYLESWKEDYQLLNFSESYKSYMNRFGTLLTGVTLADWSGLEILETGLDERNDNVFALQLTDDQVASFSSAQLLVLGSAFTDFHQPCYTPLYIAEAKLNGNGALTASYNGRALYLIDEDGSPVKGPISFMPSSEPGRYSTLALYWDDLSLYDTTKIVYVAYGFDEPDRDTQDVELSSPRVYDEVSETFTNRIAFDESAFKRVCFWYDLRMMPETEGTLPGFYQWERFNGMMLADIILPYSWRLSFQDDQLTNTQLYATFQVTDVQQNTFCSPLIPIGNPNLNAVTVAPEAIETDVARFELTASVNNAALDPSFDLTYTVTNLSDTPFSISSTPIELNGCRLTSATFRQSTLTLEPADSATATISLSASDLEDLEAITSIDCTLHLYEGSSYNILQDIPLHFDLTGMEQEAMDVIAKSSSAAKISRSQVIEEPYGRFQAVAKVGVNDLQITLTANNCSEGRCKYTFSTLQMDQRQTYLYWYLSDPLEAGTEALRTIKIDRGDIDLTFLQKIGTIRTTVTVQDPDTYDILAEYPLSFTFDDLDVSALAVSDVEVIAEAEVNDVTWQLLSATYTEDNRLIGRVRIINGSDVPVKGYISVLADGVTLLGHVLTSYHDIAPGTDYCWTFNSVYDSSAHVSSLGMTDEFTYKFEDVLPLDRLAERHGKKEITTLTFSPDASSGEMGLDATVTLPEPIPLSDSEEALSMPAGKALLEGGLRADLMAVAIGSKGIGLCVEWINDTDEPIRLRLSDARADDVALSFGYSDNELLLPAHSTTVRAVSINMNYVIEAGTPIHELRFAFEAGEAKAETSVLLDAITGVEGGTLLLADALETTPARLVN